MPTLQEQYGGKVTVDLADLAAQCRMLGHPLWSPDDLDFLMERIGDARFVLLGEASHGTSEFYLWRTYLTQRLIKEKGFSLIGVEGDWPDCYRVNRYIKGYEGAGESARDVLHAFSRWPTWMWANWEIVSLAEWLRKHNDTQPAQKKVGFYGLDVYSLWESIDALVGYLDKIDPTAAEHARDAYKCFEPYRSDAQEYAWAAAFAPQSCEEDAVRMLAELRAKMPEYPHDGPESRFNAEQNAIVVKNAERYYRTMVRSGPGSWNVRDRHMAETLDRLMQHHGPGSKAVIWEHNTHIGDARATDMAGQGMVNVGELVRDGHGREGVVLVGFSSHRGSVIASGEWGAPMRRMEVPPGREGSWEDILHRASDQNKLLIFSEAHDLAGLLEPRGHRAIGVVYDPNRERYGNYVPTALPMRYDALLYIDQSRALHPLHMKPAPMREAPETFPTAF